MLTIRLRRVGTTKRPFYRVVVIESRASPDGRFVDWLGHYNPCVEPETLKVDYARVRYWMSKGARPSDTVRTLLARHPEPPADATAGEEGETAAPVSAAVDDAAADTEGDETPAAT